MADIIQDVRGLVANLLSGPAAKTAGAFFVAVIHWLYGDLTPVHMAMAALIIADWITGLSYGVMAREISSAKGFRGVIKLAIYAGVFLVGAQVDRMEIIGPLLSSGLMSTMILTESVSVLENLDKIAWFTGVEMPILRPLIARLKQSNALERRGANADH